MLGRSVANRETYDRELSSVQPARAARAAEYVRMSTDHQKYSTESQADAIRQCAEARGIEIVRTYADAEKSGLKIEGRDALSQLIEDVQTGSPDFTIVLVHDVSRWGRFQHTDESAYHECICRRVRISARGAWLGRSLLAPTSMRIVRSVSRNWIGFE